MRYTTTIYPPTDTLRECMNIHRGDKKANRMRIADLHAEWDRIPQASRIAYQKHVNSTKRGLKIIVR